MINLNYYSDYLQEIHGANWYLSRQTCTDYLMPFPSPVTGMYSNVDAQPGGPRPPTIPQASPFGNAFYGAGSGLIRSGLGAYVEKSFGSGSEYVQSNVSIIPRLIFSVLSI